MEFYKNVFQLLAFLIIIIIIYWLYRYIIYAYRTRRLDDFSLKPYNKKKNNILNRITNVLSNSRFYQKRKNKYDKYLLDNDISTYNIITLKIITGLVFSIVYLFDCFLYKLNINLLILVIIYYLGYLLIDVLLKLEYSKNLSMMNYNISKVIIIMNNNYHLNKNHQEVIDRVIKELDGPLKNEFKLVKNDLNKGLDISNALYRMYERTKLDKILYLSELLALNIKYGISITEICNILERDINKREKMDFYLNKLNNTNRLIIVLVAILPIVLGVALYLLNPNILITKNNYIVYIIEIVIYLSYLLSISFIVRRDL